MKIFLSIWIIIFYFQFSAKAENIQDFQIEGMSIGESLLKFATSEKIKLGEKNYYNDSKYIAIDLNKNDFKEKKYTYDFFQFNIKSNDINKIIYSISGIVSYKNNIEDCYKKLEEVYKEVVLIFNTWEDLGKETYDHAGTQSKITDYVLENNSRDEIQIACYDYYDDEENLDHFRIALRPYDYRIWLIDKAYK